MEPDFYAALSERREQIQQYWAQQINKPSFKALLAWAKEVQIGVHLKYDHSHDKIGVWNIRVWDLPPDNPYKLHKSYTHECSSFDEMYNFIFTKLKEL